MPPPAPRRAPYKDFLQPALQRRFSLTALVLVAVSYIEALTLSSWTSFLWSWFPIGPTGLRAFPIFLCALAIVVLRIGHAHVGIRMSNSPFDVFRQSLSSPLAAAETLLTYGLSAWLFSQVLLFSLADSHGLGWITYLSGDRARLNERALFYTVTLIVLGVWEGICHIALDLHRIVVGSVKCENQQDDGADTAKAPAAVPSKASDPWEKLANEAPRLLLRAGMQSIVVSVVQYFMTYYFLRQQAWSWAMFFFRPFYNLPKTNILPAHGPWSLWMLGRTIWTGFLLSSLWGLGNAAFTFLLAKEPLKNDKPLTAESKDPNGSLLSGLKSKKPRIAAFALWELALISKSFPARRVTIFEDIDRKDGPMWSQVYAVCIGYLKTLEKNVDEYGKPPAPKQPAVEDAKLQQDEQGMARVVPPLKTDAVWSPAPPAKGLRDSLGRMVASEGKKGEKGKTPAEEFVPIARKKAAEVANQLLSKEHQEQLSPKGLNALYHTVGLRVLAMPGVGWLFQQTFSRRLAAAVFGAPYAEITLYINAASALSQLAVASLQEDKFGNVARDVRTIIRTYTTVIKKLEAFHGGFKAHWTDLEGKKGCPEVEEVLEALKDGLAELMKAWSPYEKELGMSRTEARLANEATQKKIKPAEPVTASITTSAQPEMRQVK